MALTKPKLSQNIDTDISVFNDPILVLHQGSVTPDIDVGFLMNRSNGLTANAAVIWQESSKSFVHILTNDSGAPNANLSVQSYANVSVGNVLLINDAGIFVNGSLGTPGQVLASDGTKVYWESSTFTGGTVSNTTIFQSNTVISNTTQSTSTVTGALVVSGGVGIGNVLFINNTGDVSANIGNLFLGNISINANLGAYQLFANANVSALQNQITGANVNIQNIDANLGLFQTYANSKIGTNTNSNLVVESTTTSTSATTGALVVKGGVGVAGNVYTDKVYTTLGIYWAGNSEAFTSTTLANTAEITANLTSGQNVGLSLTETGVVAGNYGSATSIPTVVVDSKGRITSVTSNVVSTTINLAGGSGSGSVSGGGTLTVNGTANQITTAVASSTITIAFAQDITAPGNLTVVGNLVVQGNTITIGSNNLSIVDSIIDLHTFANLAAHTVDDGRDIGTRFHYYKGSDKHAFLGWENSTETLVYFQDSTEVSSNITGTFGNVQFGSLLLANTTAASSTTTGALQVRGGVGISGATYIGGLFEAVGNIVAAATTATTNTTTGAIVSRGGIAAAGVGMFGGNLVAAGGTASSSTTTGALVVTGGVGVSGALYTGGIIDATGNIVADSGTASTSTTTGALIVNGGAGISGATYIGGLTEVTGNIVAAATTVTTNTTTGAIVSRGGIAAAGIGMFGGNLVATATTTSSSTTTGALISRGGLGVAGATYIGGLLNVASTLAVSSTSALAGVVTASSATVSSSTSSGAIVVSGTNAGIGLAGNVFAGGNVYVRSRVGFTYSGNSQSTVYQQYNAATNSLDTIFG